MTAPTAPYEYAEVEVTRAGRPTVHRAAVDANMASERYAEFIVYPGDPTYGADSTGAPRELADIVTEHLRDLVRSGNAAGANVTTRQQPAREDGGVPIQFKARRKGSRKGLAG